MEDTSPQASNYRSLLNSISTIVSGIAISISGATFIGSGSPKLGLAIVLLDVVCCVYGGSMIGRGVASPPIE